MRKKKSEGWLGCFLGGAQLSAITAAIAWYLNGFIPLGGQIFLSLVGGLVIYSGLWMAYKAAIKKPLKPASLVTAAFVLTLGLLTLTPGAPDNWLLKTPIGWSVIESRWESLEQAIRDGKIQVVRKICWAGVGDSAPRDTFGSPLIDDAKSPEILRILLESGLDPDARSEGAITRLMRVYDAELAQVLLDFGADVNARDDEGMTPLMHVVRTNLDIVKTHVENGADLQAVDNVGRTVADLLGSDPAIEDYIKSQSGGQLRYGREMDYADLARRDWLVQKDLTDARSLLPTQISVTPDPMAYGQLADVEIQMSNDSDKDRVMRIEAHLNEVALFVDASHDGKIANPYQPKIDQVISWPPLALPARSSGLLKMRIIARSDWDAGDLNVDIRAQNVLDYSEGSEVNLNLYQPLSVSGSQEEDNAAWAFILAFPLSILIWVLCGRFLGAEHRLTVLSSRIAAGLFSFVLALVAYRLVMDTLKPYTEYHETQATILDRRFFLATATSSTASKTSTTTIHRVPIVSVAYRSTGKEVIATGFANQPVSPQIFRDFKLGAEVTCWFDPANPSEFVLIRGVSILMVLGTLMASGGALVLGWLALRKRPVAE